MPNLNTDHPAADKLAAFGLGRLSEADSEEIEAHLVSCEECRKHLDDLPADSFVSLVKGSACDTHAGPSDPSSDTDSSSLSKESVPPLYKKVAQIIGGNPDQQAPGAAVAGLKANGVAPFSVPRELEGHARYLILEPLGAGGMGTVYKAQHRLMERVVALKIVNQLLVTKPGAVERFTREVKAAAQLVHPNIVTAYDAEKVGDMHLLVMEFVEGKTLAQVLIEERDLPVARACEYVRQTALGLQHALERGMVHRDIKPQNLMLTTKGEIKILDFGLARFVSEEGPAGASTEHGALMGSPDYMAPEQGQDAHSADARADIYSMGCTLYHLLAGQVPFPESSLLSKLEAHRDKQPVPLYHLRPDVPVALGKVVEKMLAKDPAQRYQKPSEVADALRPFTQVQPDSAATTPAPRRPHNKRLQVPPYASVLIALAVLLGVAYWAGPIVFRVETPQGTLIIKTDDPDVQVSVKAGGKEVVLFFPREKKEIPLKVGPYEIELVGGKPGLKLSTNKFEIKGANDRPTVTIEFVPPIVQNGAKDNRPRQLNDVVDLSKAMLVASDDFVDPKKSFFLHPGMEKQFQRGRIVFEGPQSASWGHTVHTFDRDIVCEVAARVEAPPNNGWGMTLTNWKPNQPDEALRAVEILVNSKGELNVVPFRNLKNDAAKITPIGPLRVANLKKGTARNSLAVVVRGGKTLTIFVNGVETCEPIILKDAMAPVHIQLAVVGGEKESVLAFESFKVWSLETNPSAEPMPLSEWRKGRAFLTVAQKGPADHRTIQDALDAVKAGQYVKVLDAGPYRETLYHARQVEDIGLVSDVGTRIEAPQWRPWGPSPTDKAKTIYLGCVLQASQGLRLSGFDLRMPPLPPDTDFVNGTEVNGSGDIVIESCRVRSHRDPSSEKEPVRPSYGLVLGCWSAGGTGKHGRVVLQHNLFDGLVELRSDIPMDVTVRHNWIRAGNREALVLPVDPLGTIAVTHNILQGGGGIVQRARGPEKKPLGRCLVSNNVIDVGNAPFWCHSVEFFPKNERANRHALSRDVRIQNNIIRSQSGTGLEAHADDQKAVLGVWKLGHNSFTAEPRQFATNLPPFPRQATDLIVAGPFLSDDSKHADFMRIPADGRLATSGVGGDLATYVGALPPGPAPKDGDWFTRLLEAAKSVPTAPSVKELLASARAAIDQQQAERAVAICTDVLRTEPTNVDAFFVRGSANVNLAKWVQADADLSAVLKLDPKHDAARSNRTHVYLNTGRLKECIADANLVLSRNKNDAAPLLNRIGAYAYTGRFDRALLDFEEFFRLFPNHVLIPDTLRDRGLLHRRMGNEALAQADIEKALALKPALKDTLAYFRSVGEIVPQPVPLAEWLEGREILTVSQDGKGQYKSIKDALDVLKAGQVIKVLDKGPYRERWDKNLPEDVGIISEAGARIELPDFSKGGPDPNDPTKVYYMGSTLTTKKGIRLAGLEFAGPSPPADTWVVRLLDVWATGDVVVERCRFLHNPRFGDVPPSEKDRPKYLTDAILFNGPPKASPWTRVFVAESHFEGALEVHHFPAQLVIEKNRILGWSGNGIFINQRTGEVVIRHNIVQALNSIYFQTMRSQNDDFVPTKVTVNNNLFDNVGVPVVFTQLNKDEKDKMPLFTAVQFQNNILRTHPEFGGLHVPAKDLPKAKKHWQVGHNCYLSEPPKLNVCFPLQEKDVVLRQQFLSYDPMHMDYLRIAADGPLANRGAGVHLPNYIGPVPPGPAAQRRRLVLTPTRTQMNGSRNRQTVSDPQELLPGAFIEEIHGGSFGTGPKILRGDDAIGIHWAEDPCNLASQQFHPFELRQDCRGGDSRIGPYGAVSVPLNHDLGGRRPLQVV